jgi:hypothetical protein
VLVIFCFTLYGHTQAKAKNERFFDFHLGDGFRFAPKRHCPILALKSAWMLASKPESGCQLVTGGIPGLADADVNL